MAHLVYRYDANGNIGAIADLLDDANSVLFGYDEMDRLTMAVSASSGTPASYSYTTGTNQLASVTDGSGTRTIAYDDRGNTESETRPGSVALATQYDGYGRLTEYDRSDLGDPAEFVYNGLDDRVTMILPTAGTRRFVYDSAGRVMGEYGASASDVQAEFIWLLPEVGASGTFGGDDRLGGYMPLAVATPDSSSAIQLNWIHADHLGTPIMATDALGDPAATPDDYLAAAFPGQSRMFGDLYYNRYRDYDPTTGRYIQGDPIGLGGGSNLYLYAGANPVNAIDPMGLCDRAIGRSFETGPFFPLDCASEALEKANRHARGEILCVDSWEVGENLLIGAGLALAGEGIPKLFKSPFLRKLMRDERGGRRLGRANMEAIPILMQAENSTMGKGHEPAHKGPAKELPANMTIHISRPIGHRQALRKRLLKPNLDVCRLAEELARPTITTRRNRQAEGLENKVVITRSKPESLR